jgi:hypothetical protein
MNPNINAASLDLIINPTIEERIAIANTKREAIDNLEFFLFHFSLYIFVGLYIFVKIN